MTDATRGAAPLGAAPRHVRRPAHHVVRHGDQLLLHHDAEFWHVDLPADEVRELASALAREPQRPVELAVGAGLDEVCREFLPPAHHEPTGVALLTGSDPRLLPLVGALLDGQGVDVRPGPDDLAPQEAAVLVVCDGWLDDDRWQQAARWARTRQLPLVGCFAEGSSWYLPPVRHDGCTADHLDLRARRLAAAPDPAMLASLWRELADDATLPPLPPATAAMLAGLVAAQALAVLTGQPTQCGFAALELTEERTLLRHPVLPVPR